VVDYNQPRLRLGDILLAAGAIDQAQLQAALGEQKKWGRPLGATLVDMGMLDEIEMTRALAAQLELPVVQLVGKRVNSEILELVPRELAEKWRCLPLLTRVQGPSTVLYLCMADPTNCDALDDVAFQVDMSVQPVLAAPSEIDDAILRLYGAIESADARSESLPALLDSGSEPSDDALPALGDKPVFIGLDDPDEAEAPEAPAVPRASSDRAASSAAAEFSNDTMLRAIAQLLVERGIFTRDELVERLTAVAAPRDDG
jgi:type IV pilus assembly protein PilB